MTKLKICVFSMIALLFGCANPKPRAFINDVSVPYAINTGYTVAAIDGKPVERLRGKVVTMVPYAIVVPGTHSLTLRPEKTSELPQEDISITTTFEADKTYRVASQDGRISMVEDLRD